MASGQTVRASSGRVEAKGPLLALGVLSAATLAFEIALTRIFAVAQFYHFAFMIVSLALLGSGASGTAMTLFPRWQRLPPRRALARAGWGLALSTFAAYLLTLYLPFDSFRIAHDARQVGVLFLHYVALATPFFFSGLAVGALLSAWPERQNRVYAANMTGSALGCLLALAAPPLVGGEGTVLIVAALGIAAALLALHGAPAREAGFARRWGSLLLHLVALCGAVLLAVFLPPALQIRLSPYKGLSYALLLPDAERVWQRWNSVSRVDVVRSSSIRSLPGQGFVCNAGPPPQRGLTIDGDELSPISAAPPGFTDLPFTDCMLGALPHRLRPGAHALVIEPRGGFDVLLALAEGAERVTAVEANPLVVEAVRREGAWAGALYDDPRVRVVVEDGRAFMRRSGVRPPDERYDLVVLALTAPQRTIVSGAYSLAEDYTYTVPAFRDALDLLDAGGLLVVTRWLQVPPSESIRAFALAAEAVAQRGGDPSASLVALRSYRQMLILARAGAFTEAEVDQIRAFAAQRAFDLVYAPGIRADEVNRHNVLPAPDYYDACTELLAAQDRAAWYRQYPFDVTPPTDNHPFFGHFFKWGQVGAVVQMAGHTWQPFGGAGYLVLLLLLLLATLATLILILLPLLLGRRRRKPPEGVGKTVVYFALLGLGYLCVEIPMMQWFILFLGHPAWAMATVLFALLLFSGVGSRLSHHLPLRFVLPAIPVLVALYAMGVPALFRVALVAPLWARAALSLLVLAPPGLLMGMPFPGGLASLCRDPALVPWAWASNGTFSVIASILAALLALTGGFAAVLGLGAVCYLGAWIILKASTSPAVSPAPPHPIRSPRR